MVGPEPLFATPCWPCFGSHQRKREKGEWREGEGRRRPVRNAEALETQKKGERRGGRKGGKKKEERSEG